MTTLYDREAVDKIARLIKDTRTALMATFDPSGHVFHARPMMAVSEGFDDAILWFFTAADTQKVDDIHLHPTTLLTYANPGAHNYVSLSGRAYVLRDQALIDQYWTDAAKIWFPKGKDDPNLVLIRFDAIEAEFWDSPSDPLTTGYKAIKALFTGKPPEDMSETGHVTFKSTPAVPADIDYERAAAASSDVLTGEPSPRELIGIEPDIRR